MVRNQDGDYQVSVPALPADEDEPAPNEDEKEAKSMQACGRCVGDFWAYEEVELDARIADLCRNRNRQSGEPSGRLAGWLLYFGQI